MKILSISTILPIPDVFKTNDFVFQTYINYKKLYCEDHVVIIKPVKLSFHLFDILGKRTRLQRLKKQFQLSIHGFQVEIFPFLSSWGFRNLHSILTRSIFYLNRSRIKYLLASNQFDIIHAQYIFSDGMLAYLINKKFGIPYFITSHNERYYFNHFLSRRMAIQILRNANKVTPINWTNADYFKSVGLKNIELTPLGFGKAFIKPQKAANTDKVRLLTISALIKLKNIDKVIFSIKDLVHQYDISYTIIGSGPEREKLEELAREHHLTHHINFCEYVPHERIAEEMYRYDIFIMPSYFETFGRVYFESMAMGIPIICAKNSGIFGFFKEGEEGISVDHENIEEITKALEFLIARPEERKRIGMNGQKLVMKHTWEHVVKALHEKYKLAAH
ncbi:MAG: glycosyltransferase [Bacteroidota bacterium]